MRNKFISSFIFLQTIFTAVTSGMTVTGQFSTTSSGLSINFENIGILNTNGTSSIEDQLIWTRTSYALENASFTIAEGFKVTSMSASVPNNASATNLQDGTFSFGQYDGESLTTELWTIGDDLPEIFSGVYAIQWYVPAKGSGGSSSAFGNGTFSITVEAIPEPSNYALASGILAICLVMLRRRYTSGLFKNIKCN
jgi:hypothetical protein